MHVQSLQNTEVHTSHIKPDIVQNVLLEDLDVRVRSFP